MVIYSELKIVCSKNTWYIFKIRSIQQNYSNKISNKFRNKIND